MSGPPKILRGAIFLHAFVVPLFYELPGMGFRLTTNDVLSALILVAWEAWVTYYLVARRDPGPAVTLLGPLLPATVAFALSHVFSAAFASDVLVAARETVKTIGVLAFLLIAQGLVLDPADRLRLAWAATLGAAVASALAVVEAFSWGGARAYSGLRPSATTGNPNTLGAYLAALLPVAFGLVAGYISKFRHASGRGDRVLRALAGALAVLLAALITLALMLTLSRGSWISALAAAVVFVAVAVRSAVAIGKRQAARGLVVTVGAFAAAIALLGWLTPAPARDSVWAAVTARARSLTSPASSSDRVRVILVQAAWRMFQEHPLLGVGPGNFATEIALVAPQVMGGQEKELLPLVTAMEFPHNWPLQVAAENGTIGLVAFGWWVAILLVRGYRRATHAFMEPATNPTAHVDAWLILSGFAGVVATLVGSLFGYPFVHTIWEPFAYTIILSDAGTPVRWSPGRGRTPVPTS